MQYLALIYADESEWDGLDDGGRAATIEDYGEFVGKARAAGVMVAVDELGPTRDATTVRVRDAQTLVLDGPYAEVKEALGGTSSSSASRSRRRASGPRASLERRPERSRFALCTAILRRHTCEVRTAHLHRPDRMGGDVS